MSVVHINPENPTGRVLITGANGQLGWELQRTVPHGYKPTLLDKGGLDIIDESAVACCVEELQPNLIINAAAYTAVDKAEEDQEAAYAVNATGAGNLARASAATGCRLIQISTDFVFDGSQSTPYLPTDRPSPLGVYGDSKLKGEKLVSEITNGQALILRTAWVYSCQGSNFVKSMLRIMDQHDHLRVVADQVGTPSWAKGIAQAIWALAGLGEAKGIYHWTDAGVASWYDFAVAIQEEALAIGLLKERVTISPIRTEDYPVAAQRPSYSVLDKTSTWKLLGDTAPHWRQSLRGMLLELKEYRTPDN